MPANVLENAPNLQDAFRTVTKVKAIVTDAMEDGVRSATQAIRHTRHAAEDAIDDAKHTVRQKPFQSVGVAFAAGVLAGGLFTWVGMRCRR
ncbi:MAG: hypothetical protein KGM96_06705 [Acidobacteriota bacterium]|nr:hypothetical protein [Acidobacteriota bacterium]